MMDEEELGPPLEHDVIQDDEEQEGQIQLSSTSTTLAISSSCEDNREEEEEDSAPVDFQVHTEFISMSKECIVLMYIFIIM